MNALPRSVALTAAATLALPALAFGATYPEKPVRWVVPSVAGGGTDTATRIIAPKFGEAIGQQIVIENRGGASGNIGAEYVARAAPDGYTLLTCIASNASNLALMKKVPFDLVRDFAPISLMVTVPGDDPLASRRCRRKTFASWWPWRKRAPASCSIRPAVSVRFSTWRWSSSSSPPAPGCCTCRTRPRTRR